MKVFEKSVRTKDGIRIYMAEEAGVTALYAEGDVGFSGETKVIDGKTVTVAPLTHENALVLRKLFLFTAPIRVLGKERSFGVGDRLGIATPGHIAVFEKYDAYPVLAQQSMRELTLTDRTYEDVLDCATFAVYRDGFEKGFGADGDHLKKAEDVRYALDLGFTMITLDCSDHIDNDAASLSDAEVEAKYEKNAEIEDIYLGKTFDVGEGITVSFTAEELRRIVLVYGKAIDFAVSIYEEFFSGGKYNADFEISIDETLTPTTPLQHFFVANELVRRGVKFETMAPRFCGEFQKGIDYIGDIAQFTEEMTVHSQLARHFGYKLSIHSGSDKFSTFPIIGEKCRGIFHVKTAGTNWLEAMRVIAMVDPKFYREVHAYALEAFDEATKYYHVTTDLGKVPALDTMTDADLPKYFDMNDARQLIHITYGLILSRKNADGSFTFRDKLYSLWREHEAVYTDALVRHIGRHLNLLGVKEN